jgi:cell division protein FtsB
MRVPLAEPTLPADPATGVGLPAGIFDGPYGYLAAIAFFLFLAARELRRYREIDVTTYKTEIAALKEDLQALTAEVHLLRDEKFDGARQAALDKEALIRENAFMRALCAENGIDTTGVTQ